MIPGKQNKKQECWMAEKSCLKEVMIYLTPFDNFLEYYNWLQLQSYLEYKYLTAAWHEQGL